MVSLILVTVIALGALAGTLGSKWSPKLGLDLAGGSEVVYKPAHTIDSGEMNTTIDIIRNRIDGAGVSGAEVGSQGGNVVVQLPGLRNPGKVINLIGETAQLQFRPVLCYANPYTAPTAKTVVPTTVPSACSASSYDLTATNLAVNTSSGDPANNVGADPVLTDYPSTTNDYNDAHPYLPVLIPAAPQSGQSGLRYLLGPTGLLGNAVAPGGALAELSSSTWVVDVTLTGTGSGEWDKLAEQQFHAYIAMDLDGLVYSAPLTLPNQATFTSFAGKIQISGSFTQTEAQNLALVLNYGALPVRLKPIERQSVSPTLGKSSLKAGLAAGIGGLLLVLIYTILYYRALGVVVVSGLIVSGALLWSIVSALGHSSLNLTLDLAGVTGVIVSVGITVDSYIVYFERLKDEARAGRSIRTSVDKSFRGAFRTVLAADLVSLGAAVVLYFLAIGTVQGFAFFLGLSTILDIVITYFFTRPLVILLGRSKTVTDARIIGVARGLALESGS